MFLNRSDELQELDAIYSRRQAQFVALFGRRRIGKTSLLSYWLQYDKKKSYIFWTARKTTSKILLKSFSTACFPFMDTVDTDFCFSSWENALKQLAEIAQKKKVIVVIDEFPYLCYGIQIIPHTF